MNETTSRRGFLKASASSLAGLSLLDPGLAKNLLSAGPMPRRPLGKTGFDVKIYSLGGQSTLEEERTDELSGAIIHRALDLGINYIDTAAAYGDGISEKYIGKVMKTRRKEVYLASKTHDRSYDGSMRLLERSLNNLQTDHLDAWQVHNVRTNEDLEKMFAPDGVVKALQKARDEKLVRFLGVTGHRDPFVLAEGLRRFEFDTILMALNPADKHFNSFIDNLLPLCVEKQLGIIGMKVPGRGRVFKEGGVTKMEQAMRYVLTQPISTIIVGIDTIEHLEENVRIAQNYNPMNGEELAHLEELTQSYHEDAAFFKHHW